MHGSAVRYCSVKPRIGLLKPECDAVPESEFRAMVRDRVDLSSAELRYRPRLGDAADNWPGSSLGPIREVVEPLNIERAVGALDKASVCSIAFGFTSSAFVIGAAAEELMVQRLTEVAKGIPVITPTIASVDALRALGATHIALVEPPWFESILCDLGRRYYALSGFDVVYCAAADLQGEPSRIDDLDLASWVRCHVPRTAEAVIIGGNGLPAIGAISTIESDRGVPVLTANQVLLWAALTRCGFDASLIEGYGQVFNLHSTLEVS